MNKSTSHQTTGRFKDRFPGYDNAAYRRLRDQIGRLSSMPNIEESARAAGSANLFDMFSNFAGSRERLGGTSASSSPPNGGNVPPSGGNNGGNNRPPHGTGFSTPEPEDIPRPRGTWSQDEADVIQRTAQKHFDAAKEWIGGDRNFADRLQQFGTRAVGEILHNVYARVNREFSESLKELEGRAERGEISRDDFLNQDRKLSAMKSAVRKSIQRKVGTLVQDVLGVDFGMAQDILREGKDQYYEESAGAVGGSFRERLRKAGLRFSRRFTGREEDDIRAGFTPLDYSRETGRYMAGYPAYEGGGRGGGAGRGGGGYGHSMMNNMWQIVPG